MKFKIKSILTFVFLVSLFLNLFGIWWGLPNYYTWSTDDLTPNTPLLIAKNHLHIESRYPAFHFLLLDVIYAPYLGYLFLTGGLINPHAGFPYGFTDPLTSLTVLLVLSRIVSTIMGALTVVFVYLAVKTLYGKKPALFSALSIAFSYIFILFSHFGNLDIPYLFWFSIAIYSYVKLIKTFKLKYYILLGIFTAISIATKDQIVGYFILLPIPLIYFHIKHHLNLKKGNWKSAILNKKLIYCLLALVLTYSIFSGLIFDFSGFKYRMNFWIDSSISTGKYAQFPSGLNGQINLFIDFLKKINYSIGLPLSLLFLIVFFYSLFKIDKYKISLLIPLAGYYFLDIARIHYLYYRMTLPIILIFAILLGSFLYDLFRLKKSRKIILIVLSLIYLYTFIYGFSANLTLIYDSRHSAEEWMTQNIDKESKIEVYQKSTILPRFHALGFNNVSFVFLNYNGTEIPKPLLFKPVIDDPNIESLRKRNPDYIILSECCYNYSKMEKDHFVYLKNLKEGKTNYKVVAKFNNKIPFAPETPFLYKRTNIPVIILKKES